MLSWFSPQRTDYKINYEDVQKCRGSYLIINTLPLEEQNCLIVGTIPATQEAKRVNELSLKTLLQLLLFMEKTVMMKQFQLNTIN